MERQTDRTGKITHISQLLPEQLQAPVPFEVVELTTEEKEKVILEAMVKKHAMLEDERRKALAEKKRNDMLNAITRPNELWNLARWRGTQLISYRSGNPTIEFEPMDFQKPIITALCLYFCNDEKFEDLDISKYNKTGLSFNLNKGLWMWGNPGVGKSVMMEIFNRNTRLCYDIVQCPKLVHGYSKFGDDAIRDLMSEVRAIKGDNNFGQEIKGICYNDLGTENTKAIHYGNSINVMEQIMMQTYENKVPYWHRHVITNLTFAQVKEAYGVRITDRIKECFNILEVNGESLRK
jgi:hypothetical protein